MSFSTKRSGQRVDISMQGQLYVEEATDLREKLLREVDGGASQFHFDFSRLDYIDSAGLGVLISVQKRAASVGGQVSVSGLSGMVKEIFELTRLDRIFPVR